ncbi:MAG: class I SAM-dependent methyltransferase [Acidobacteriota bacterium]
MNTVERFSDRIENYVRYRPGYPPEVLDLFRNDLGLEKDSIVADIGSGTGISTKVFLENGNVVFGVEPNDGMRVAAEQYLAAFPSFRSIKGTAENTGLNEASVDFVVSAQAFHWFDQAAARQEFVWILKPSGIVALIWNQRQVDTTPFLIEYEKFLLKYANDYEQVRHENVNEEALGSFFGKSFSQKAFKNVQILDFDGLKGRVLSSSYMPAEPDPRFLRMVSELETLFAKHAENDKIEVLYDTIVNWSSI